jgi:cytochrome bd ubiquinol oxidase subunit I
VPQWAHFFAAVMVAVGTLFSTFWILVVNSWMQTPTGFSLQNGRFFPDDWAAVIWNPSFPFRFLHVVVAVYLTTAFTVIGVAAYHLRNRRFVEESRVMILMGISLATILVPLQALIGDAHGVNTLEHQPIKLAAIEGIWETQRGVPAVVFAIPDENTESNKFEIGIPKLASLYLTHDLNGEVKGLKSVPREDRPPVVPVFFGFRVMVGMWAIMLLITVSSWYLLWRRKIYETGWFLRLCSYAIPVGYVAVTAGWVTTEVGRQPYVVYGHLRTADAVTPSLATHDVVVSLLLYVLVYGAVFGAGVYYLVKLTKAGPATVEHPPEAELLKRPARPLSAAD